jgi:hypothetical protein
MSGSSLLRNRFLTLVFALVVLAGMPVTLARTSQQGPPEKSKNVSHVPDLSGVWFIRDPDHRLRPKDDPPPFQPWAKAEYTARGKASSESDPDSGPDPAPKCIPPGVPRIMLQPLPWEIVQAPHRVVIVYEYQAMTRQIYMDGRAHPKDLSPTYMGHSIGRYEGDALVIDVAGFNDKTWLDVGGLPHSDALHVIERFRRLDRDTLEDEVTIDDPKTYTKPWRAKKVFERKPGWDIQEYVCAENNEYH